MKKRILSIILLVTFMSLCILPFSNIKYNNVQQEELIIIEEEPVPLSINANDAPTITIKTLKPTIQEIATIEYSQHMSLLNIPSIDKLTWFLQYKNIINRYSEVLDTPETVYDYFTEEEIILMWRTIETETYQASFIPKCNVASVILNRFESEDFPNDMTTIITSVNQFCYGRTIITEDTKLALEYAFEIKDTSKGGLAFRSGKKTETHCGYPYLFTDEAGHHIYGEKTNE